MEIFIITDFKTSVIKKMSQTLKISAGDAEKIFLVLRSEEYPFLGHELIVVSEETGSNGLIMSDGIYSLNIKKILLCLIAFALDIHLTQGAASLALQFIGLDGQALYKFDAENGERCIAREIVLHGQADKSILSGKECVNNDLSCKYREEGLCTCPPAKVEEIFIKWQELSIIKPTHTEGVYEISRL